MIFRTITDDVTGANKSIGLFGLSLQNVSNKLQEIKRVGFKEAVFNSSKIDDKASDGILLEKAIPMSYQQGLTSQEYTFTLTNNASIPMDYTLSLEDISRYLDDNNTKHLCILHELAHCLTSSEASISCGGFNEPVAELITNSICESQNIDFDFSYRDVSMIYMIICNCYGFNESIHDFYYGTFIDNLNSITNKS